MTEWTNDRPSDWAERIDHWLSSDDEHDDEVTGKALIEAGARLMLAALREGGIRFKAGDPEGMSYDEFDAVMGQWRDGHVVWIPEVK